MLKTYTFFIFLFLAVLPLCTSKLEMVVEVFRHGARQPTSAPYDSFDWSEYVGELTFAGMRQHYLLGKEMRKRYIEELAFISTSFNHSELFVRSTDYNRTIMSVQSHLLGLYPLGAGPKFPDNFPLDRAVPPYQADYDIEDLGYNVLLERFQPIPVHMTEKKNDNLLSPTNSCPNYKVFYQQQKETEVYQGFKERFQPIFDKVKEVFNISYEINLSNLGTITTDVQCAIMENIPLPQNLTPELLNNMTFLKGLEVQYLDVGRDDQRIVLSSTFFKTVLHYFESRISNKSPLKYVIFSAHDTTLQPFMAVLNLTNWQCLLNKLDSSEVQGNCVPGFPIFASQIIIELHSKITENGNTVWFVKVIYNGIEMKLCDSDSTECLLEEFGQRLSHYILNDDDYDELCGIVRNEYEMKKFLQNLEQ